MFAKQTARRTPNGPKNAVFVSGDLDFNLWPDLPTRPSEGPNTSSIIPCEFSTHPVSVSQDI